jgi:predicted enzyme related to lactoylglutathione lyase
MSRFRLYELRTTDVIAARAFYSDILGAELPGPELLGTDSPGADVSVIALPERAAEQGAPAHWLGHIGVVDVEATLARALAAGGRALGPVRHAAGGVERAALRDPFGAVLGLCRESVGAHESRVGIEARPAHVAWHLLHASDHAQAFAWYGSSFGWLALDEQELETGLGRQQVFAWEGSTEPVGSVAGSARHAHIHPHWMFCFRVADLAGSLARVRQQGGKALDPVTQASGDRIAPCEDPQGAAFALYQRRHATG